nr:MAG: capsid protein [ssDNA virus sp.]
MSATYPPRVTFPLGRKVLDLFISGTFHDLGQFSVLRVNHTEFSGHTGGLLIVVGVVHLRGESVHLGERSNLLNGANLSELQSGPDNHAVIQEVALGGRHDDTGGVDRGDVGHLNLAVGRYSVIHTVPLCLTLSDRGLITEFRSDVGSVELGHGMSLSTHTTGLVGSEERQFRLGILSDDRDRIVVSGVRRDDTIDSRVVPFLKDKGNQILHLKALLRVGGTETITVREKGVVDVELVRQSSDGILRGNSLIALDGGEGSRSDVAEASKAGFKSRHALIGNCLVENGVEQVLRRDVINTKSDISDGGGEHGGAGESNILLDDAAELGVHAETRVGFLDDFLVRSVDSDKGHLSSFGRKV